MKKQATLLLAALLVAFGAQATVRTVSNHPQLPAQYSDLQTAINACSLDDTVYVHGSPINYGGITIKKRIVLMGAGYGVQNVQQAQPAVLGAITLDTATGLASQIHGIKILGLEFSQTNQSNGGNYPINNVVVERCKIPGIFTIYGSGWVFRNCILNGLHLGGGGWPPSNNALITNCLVFNSINGSGATGAQENVGVVITNNIFFLSNSIGSLRNAVISNNVFHFTPTASFSNVANNVWNNNILNNAGTLPPAGNSGSGNLSSTNPSFVNAPVSTVSISTAHTFNYAYSAGSPAINAGTDGTNTGSSGGGSPMTIFDGATRLPQISEMNIQNSVVNQGTNLNVQFKARKRN